MTSRRSVQLLRGVASLITTLALLVGVPLLLATLVGWPLPRSLPSVDSLEEAARSGINDQVVVKTLAVVAWITWAQLALSLLVESLAVARGRQAIRLPVLPGFQLTAARLIAGILVVASTVHPTRAHAAPQPIPVAAESLIAAAPADTPFVMSFDGEAPVLIAQTDEVPAPATATEHPTVTVQRHDSYWAIAERTLGDGFRWREILDLNAGRTLPDGTVINAGDETLHAGWVLLLPADATGDPAPQVDASSPVSEDGAIFAASSVVVEPGDNLWTISEDRLEVDLGRDATDPEVAPYWREVIEANQDEYVEPGNPNLILPGQVIDLPPTGHEPPAPPIEVVPEPAPEVEPVEPPPPPEDLEEPIPDPSVTSTPVAPSVEADEPASAADDDADHEEADRALAEAAALGGLSSIALAVGLKRLIDRRRRRYMNEHDGELRGRTPVEQRELHQAIVAQADEERIDDLQGALGRLAAALAAEGSARRPRMIRHAATSLEVLLDQPDSNPPAGWTTSEDGTIWTLTARHDLDEPYDGPLCPTPLMVTVGQPEDDAQLYLDLEADGLIALVGDPAVAMDLARSILTEMTLSPLAETLRVISLGSIVNESAKVLEHLTLVDSWDGIAEDLVAWAAQSHGALTERDWPNAFIGRGHDADHDALVPIAVVADRPPPPELAEALRASQPSAVAVVVVGAFPQAAASVRCRPDSLDFDMIDVACTPQALDGDELDDISRVVVAIDSPSEQALIDELRAEYEAGASTNGSTPIPHESNGHEPSLLSAEPPAFDVLVRLLGAITVEGGRPLKPKATAVVAYIAMNRSVTTERLEEACWFGSEGVTHIKRVHDTMTEARAALGSQHLPANRTGTYDAGPRLRTDIELFEWHVKRATHLDPTEAVAHYRAALDLVTGKPFTYTNGSRRSYGWVDYEHLESTWEQRVAGTAQACAALYLDLGEPGEAIAMLRQIVQAIPLNSAVVESLMRAHLANDDRAAAERVYKEHVAALDQAKLGDPPDSIEQLRLDLRAS